MYMLLHTHSVHCCCSMPVCMLLPLHQFTFFSLSFLPPGRQLHFQSLCKTGEKLSSHGNLSNKVIGHRVSTLQDRWKKLNDMASSRRTRLEEAVRLQQVGVVSVHVQTYCTHACMHIHVHCTALLSLVLTHSHILTPSHPHSTTLTPVQLTRG